MDDYYEILGVERGASTDEIRRAYRRQAKKWHPDINKDPSATERMKKINEAHTTLIDESSRREYDREHGRDEFRGSGFGFTSDPFTRAYGSASDYWTSYEPEYDWTPPPPPPPPDYSFDTDQVFFAERDYEMELAGLLRGGDVFKRDIDRMLMNAGFVHDIAFGEVEQTIDNSGGVVRLFGRLYIPGFTDDDWQKLSDHLASDHDAMRTGDGWVSKDNKNTFTRGLRAGERLKPHDVADFEQAYEDYMAWQSSEDFQESEPPREQSFSDENVYYAYMSDSNESGDMATPDEFKQWMDDLMDKAGADEHLTFGDVDLWTDSERSYAGAYMFNPGLSDTEYETLAAHLMKDGYRFDGQQWITPTHDSVFRRKFDTDNLDDADFDLFEDAHESYVEFREQRSRTSEPPPRDDTEPPRSEFRAKTIRNDEPPPPTGGYQYSFFDLGEENRGFGRRRRGRL